VVPIDEQEEHSNFPLFTHPIIDYYSTVAIIVIVVIITCFVRSYLIKFSIVIKFERLKPKISSVVRG
jgi:hypothetical protein